MLFFEKSDLSSSPHGHMPCGMPTRPNRVDPPGVANTPVVIKPLPTPTPDLPTASVTYTPNITRTALLPTPTDFQLPFNDQPYDQKLCQPPDVLLPISAAQGLSEDEIAAKLVEKWLAFFNNPKNPGYCRIDGYRIDKVYYDPRTPYLPLEPKGDIMRVVQYSIKLVQIPNYWMSLSGEIDSQNWLHTASNLAVFRSKKGYTFKFAFP